MQPWDAMLHMTSVSHGSCCSTFKGDLTRPCIRTFRSAACDSRLHDSSFLD